MYYQNRTETNRKIESIIFCNADPSITYKIYLVLQNPDENTIRGAIFYGTDLEAGEPLEKENFYLQPYEAIFAWSNKTGVVAMNINILEDGDL